MSKTVLHCIASGASTVAASVVVCKSALAVPAMQATSLADLSLEEPGDVVVTSVSRRRERLAAAPASIYVISRDDIRRAGVTSLPGALRLAPNLQVARADTNQYAITARGANAVLANNADGRVRFEVNVAVAEKSGVRLSSRLLTVAMRVRPS